MSVDYPWTPIVHWPITKRTIDMRVDPPPTTLPLRVTFARRVAGRNFHLGLCLPIVDVEESKRPDLLLVLQELADVLQKLGAYGGQEWTRADIMQFPEPL